mmetsp:Transcript_69223/g.144288  ORF Transcript_69223/g.144288 Transcript_69223/m.144288 type:complete len:207 (+) Transcript_69223:322-942(+)
MKFLYASSYTGKSGVNSCLSKKIEKHTSISRKEVSKKNLKVPAINFCGRTSLTFSILLSVSFLNNLKPLSQMVSTNNNQLLNSVVIDANYLNLRREDIFNEKFLFSPQTTRNSEVESEIEEIEDDEYRYSAWRNTQIGLAVGGSALGMWFAYNGLNAWERWMKEQEKKDIEEEIQMTGTYINPGAGNVEASIDPITGKKNSNKETN